MLFVEAVWANCCDGLYMPLEIAFTSCPTKVTILKVAPLPSYYWLTFRDWANNRSRAHNKDRFYNSNCKKLNLNVHVRQLKLRASTWRFQLHKIIPLETVLYARGRSQYRFFKYVCGYPNVKRVKLSTGRKITKVYHDHSPSRLIRYPCPGVEVTTMAYYKSDIQVRKKRYIWQ